MWNMNPVTRVHGQGKKRGSYDRARERRNAVKQIRDELV
jgi:hypothetical protein